MFGHSLSERNSSFAYVQLHFYAEFAVYHINSISGLASKAFSDWGLRQDNRVLQYNRFIQNEVGFYPPYILSHSPPFFKGFTILVANLIQFEIPFCCTHCNSSINSIMDRAILSRANSPWCIGGGYGGGVVLLVIV